MDKQNYVKLVDKISPPSKKGRDFFLAFFVGGIICTIGQLLREFFLSIGFSEELTSMSVCTILIFLAALLTGLKLFEKIARFAGAGTLVPITGFANAVVAPAIEFKTEGYILGLGAKMFTIAGPVIVYGVSASVLYGYIYWITTLL
jgi:stage V sporulation protein AC